MRPRGRRHWFAVPVALAGALLAVAAGPAAALRAPAPNPGPSGRSCAGGPGGLVGCIPGPGDLVRGAVSAAGTGAMQGFTSFFTDGAKWFIDQLTQFLVAADQPDLSAGWWIHRYDLMLALAVVVAAATLLLALLDAAGKASLDGLGRALWLDVPVAGLVGGVAPPLVQYLVDVADWLSGRLLADFGADAGKALASSAEWFATFSGATGNPGVPLVAGFLAALLTILGALLVFLELLLRANAIYLIAALIPVVYAVRIWPAARSVGRRTTEALLAVIMAQPVVALAVSLGAAAGAQLDGVGGASTKQFGTAIAGAVFLLLAALAPWGVVALMPGLEAISAAYRQRAAVGGGVRSTVQVAYTGTYLGRLASVGSRRWSGQATGPRAAGTGWVPSGGGGAGQDVAMTGRWTAQPVGGSGSAASPSTSSAKGSPAGRPSDAPPAGQGPDRPPRSSAPPKPPGRRGRSQPPDRPDGRRKQ